MRLKVICVFLAAFATIAHATDFPVGANPCAIALADFNNDGKMDVVAVNTNSGTVSVLLNDGAGGFLPQQTFTVQTQPVAVAVGDFNKDGNMDIVVANGVSNSVTILLGDGTGGFTAQNIPIPNGVGSTACLAVADFNEDGNLDIFVGNPGSSLLIGDGTGSFTIKTGSGSSFNTRSAIAVADLDGDGHKDVVGLNDEFGVLLLFGDGTGNFTQATQGMPDSNTSGCRTHRMRLTSN